MSTEYYTIKEASQILGVAYDTVWKWMKSGKIEYGIHAGRQLISQEQLDDFMAANKKYGNPTNAMIRYYSSIVLDPDIISKLDREIDELIEAKNLIDCSIYQKRKQKEIILQARRCER